MYHVLDLPQCQETEEVDPRQEIELWEVLGVEELLREELSGAGLNKLFILDWVMQFMKWKGRPIISKRNEAWTDKSEHEVQ